MTEPSAGPSTGLGTAPTSGPGTGRPVGVRPTTSPYLRLDHRLGWRLGPADSRPQVPHDDRPLRLAVAGRCPIAVGEPFGTFGGRTLPRGLAVSSEGRVFLADPAGRVVLSATVDAAADPPPVGAAPGWPFSPLWPARPLPDRAGEALDGLGSPGGPDAADGVARPDDPYTLVRPVDVAVGPDGDLVVVDEGAARVLVLAWPTAQLRRVVDLAPGRPRSVCFDAVGRAYVADLATVHRFDREWRRDPDFPREPLSRPDVVGAARTGPAGSVDRAAARRPVVWVLDGGRPVALDEVGRLLPDVALPDAAPAGSALAGRDADLTPPPLRLDEGVTDPGGVPGPGLTWSDPGLPGREPVRLPRMPVSRDGRLRGTTLPLLARPRRVELPRLGSVTTTALDGVRTGFAWDRLALEVDLPPSTRLLVSTLTSDVEIAADRLSAVPEERWSTPLSIEPGDVPEVLVQSAPGRFLWIRLEMSGDGTVSPSISTLDVYAPRRSAMRHLPSSFHDDPESARFLDRFLSYFDTVFAEVTARHRDVVRLVDPQVVPEEFLTWLGAWFDLDFDVTWPTSVRREMVAEAVTYYRQRGTVAGLKRILQWHTGLSGALPQVVEHFRIADDAPTVLLGGVPLDVGDRAHAFTIVLPAHVVDDDRAAVLHRLVAASIPAHTRYRLHLVEPGVRIASQSTLGVDMTLTSTGVGGAGVLDGGRLDDSLATGSRRPSALAPLPSAPLPSAPRSTGQGGQPCP